MRIDHAAKIVYSLSVHGLLQKQALSHLWLHAAERNRISHGEQRAYTGPAFLHASSRGTLARGHTRSSWKVGGGNRKISSGIPTHQDIDARILEPPV